MQFDRNIFVMPTAAGLRMVPGQENARYCFVQELGAVFRWVLNSSLTDDGFKVIAVSTGLLGAWVRCAAPSGPLTGAALLGNADVTINVGQGFYRQMVASTLTGNRTITLDPGNVAGPPTDNGDEIEICRFDVSAYTLTVVNGGPGAGTIKIFPGSVASMLVAVSDGTNFSYKHATLLL